MAPCRVCRDQTCPRADACSFAPPGRGSPPVTAGVLARPADRGGELTDGGCGPRSDRRPGGRLDGRRAGLALADLIDLPLRRGAALAASAPVLGAAREPHQLRRSPYRAGRGAWYRS